MTMPMETQEYASTAYRSDQAVGLPEIRAKRERVGDELQPYGAYANLNPYYRIVEDVETVQLSECSGSMIPDTNVGGNIATISEVSDDQETTIFYA